MNTFTLQTPIDKPIMLRAKKEAKKVGFRSLQELVNLFLTKVANDGLAISFSFEEQLPEKAEAKLVEGRNKAEKEIKKGDFKISNSTSEIMEGLPAIHPW